MKPWLGCSLMLVAMTTAGAAAATETVSVRELLRTPGLYAGATVRVRGLIDQCDGNVCHLCDDGTARRCISLRSWQARIDAEENLDDPPISEAALDTRYRFSSVVLRGRVYQPPSKRKALDEAVRALEMGADVFACRSTRDCSQSGEPLLDYVTVERVGWRPKAIDDLMFTEDGALPLQRLPATDVAEMVAELGDALPRDHGETRGFSAPGYDGGWLCVSARADAWPTKLGQVPRSPTLPHRCWYINRIASNWSYAPDE